MRIDRFIQCAAQVWKRDTYRVDRGTKSGFSMHYNRCRCSRAAKVNGLCRQHAKDDRVVVLFERAALHPQPSEQDHG